jgi:hypothetical protein
MSGLGRHKCKRPEYVHRRRSRLHDPVVENEYHPCPRPSIQSCHGTQQLDVVTYDEYVSMEYDETDIFPAVPIQDDPQGMSFVSSYYDTQKRHSR